MNAQTEPTVELKHQNKKQAQLFFKVMVAKNFSPEDISQTLKHMGSMFLLYAEDKVEEAKSNEV